MFIDRNRVKSRLWAFNKIKDRYVPYLIKQKLNSMREGNWDVECRLFWFPVVSVNGQNYIRQL